MPELPEIRHISDVLKSQLVGLYIFNIIIEPGNNRYNKENGLEGLNLFKNYDKNGKKHIKMKGLIKNIFFNGKKIFFEIEHKNKIFYFFSFLGLTGSWQYLKDYPHRKLTLKLGIVKGKLLIFKKNLYFNDKIGYGNFKIVEELEPILKTTGPDLFNNEISYEQFCSKIRKYPKKTIYFILTKQEYFSGIGAYLKSEILYDSKIAPNREIMSLSSSEIKKIHKSIYKILEKSYSKKGYSFSDYIDPNGNKGSYITKAHNNLDFIKYKEGNGTTVYWDPEVQK